MPTKTNKQNIPDLNPKILNPGQTVINKDSSNTLSEIPQIPYLKNISPLGFFELKRQFLELTQNYIASFISNLNSMKELYEKESKTNKITNYAKMENSISSEQYSYYSYILGLTNDIYLERIASVIIESKDYLDLFYFQVHFAYHFLSKTNDKPIEKEESETKTSKYYDKIDKILKEFKANKSFLGLSKGDKASLEKIFSSKILFGVKVHNAEAFTNGLRSLLLLYFVTKDEEFLSLYDSIKKVFWLQKSDFIAFIKSNKSFFIWIHVLLDNHKNTREQRKIQKEEILSNLEIFKKSLSNEDSYVLNSKIENFKKGIENDCRTIRSFSLEEENSPYELFGLIKFSKGDNVLASKKTEDFLKESIKFIQVGILFRRNPDLFYKSNDILYEILLGKGIYLNDLQKYFSNSSNKAGNDAIALNNIIVELSKHTLYHFLYPIFLYSLAKKLPLSNNDFRIMQDSGILMNSSLEGFIIVSNFYNDLNELVNKESNLGLTKPNSHSFWFHAKKWGILLTSSLILSVLFSVLFRFPYYFAILCVVYVLLFIFSEYLLYYKLKIFRAIAGYGVLALFFLLGGFNANYQQIATDRILEAHNYLAPTGSGSFDIGENIAKMNSSINPENLKANTKEADKSQKQSLSGEK